MFPVCVVFLTRPSSPDLLKYAMDTKPDVLVLMGPFVDAEHRIIRGEDVHVPGTNSGGGGGEGGGPLDASFEEVFAWGVRDRLGVHGCGGRRRLLPRRGGALPWSLGVMGHES